MKFFIDFILVAVIVDIIVVLNAMYALLLGSDLYHIPFWDMQIRFVVSLLN